MSNESKKWGLLAEPVHTVLRAARYASRKHKGQTRLDGNTPYISHATSVAFVLRHIFEVEDESILAAAFLHDVLEDTRTKYDELVEIFGDKIAGYVVALTKNPLLSKKERERDFEQRLVAAPELVKIAKLADLFDNLMFRLESPRLPRTLSTAKRMVIAFTNKMETDKGRRALAKMIAVIEEVTRETGVPPGEKDGEE